MIVSEIIENSLLSENSSYYELSILIGMDSFVFAVIDGNQELLALKHWHFEKISPDLVDHYKIAFRNEPLLGLPFRKVYIGVRNMKYTLIPQKLYNEKERKHYLENLIQVPDDDLVFADQIPSEKICNVFALSNQVFNFFREKFPDASFYHAVSSLLHGALKLSKSPEETILLANFNPQFMDLVLIQKGKIKLANSFPTQSPRDQLYFILLIFEQFGLNQKIQKVFYSGIADSNSKEFIQLKKYIPELFPAPDFGAVRFGEKFINQAESFQYFNIFSFPAFIQEQAL